jgi:hypothetical protein
MPAMQPFDAVEQGGDAALARHESPGAWLAREESRTEFEGLGTQQAAKLASDSFPEAIA